MTLWIKSLEVENFAGVESASIEFERGLNVCYGPNELGKSTLVKAIRAALLLQHTSSAAEELFDWHADAPPVVKLVFETEPQRIWRVRRSFGAGRDGYSYLEFSRDGQTFVQEAKGREVDGRLQDLLQWGIEAPGGKGRRRRGLPESFITTALLGEQARVTAILDRALDDDPDESGKRRLTEALQAMAEDPIFRAVFDASQSKVDEAYTGTGRRKSGRGSPWVQLRDQLQAAHDRQTEINALRQESESARVRIEDLQQDLTEAQSAAAEADRDKRRIIADLEKLEARTAAAAKLEQAERALRRIQGLNDAVQETQAEIAAKQAERDELAAAQVTLEREAAEAQTKFDEAQARVRELESGDAEQKRRIREQEIQKALLTLESKATELTARIELAGRVREKSTRAHELRAEIDDGEAHLAEAREVLSAARESFETDEQRLKDLNARLTAMRLLAARRQIAEFDDAETAAAAQREEGERLQQQARTVLDEIEGALVPSSGKIAALRALETDLRIAEEKLQVGLTAEVVPSADVDIKIAADSDDAATHRVTSAGQIFEAKGELHIEIPEFGRLVLRGGARDLVDAAASARANWEAEATPVWAETGCSTIEELDSLRFATTEREAEAKDLERQAATAFERAERTSASTAGIDSAKVGLRRFEDALESLIPDAPARSALLESLAEDDQHSEAGIEDEIQEVQNTVSGRRGLASQLEAEVSGDGGRLDGLRSELDAVERDRKATLENVVGDWEVVLAEALDEIAHVQDEKAEAGQQLSAVANEATNEVDDARDVLENARVSLDAASQAAKTAGAAITEVATAIAQLEGELGVQRETADAEDKSAAAAAVELCTTELDSLPIPDGEVDEDDRTSAERIAANAAAEVRRLQLEVREAEGALGQTGGQYIDEQAEQAREAVDAASAKEREVDLDYGAWSLLRDTLQEAESEDGVHLGNALIQPVSERMSALTAGRYGAVDIEPQLQTSGIEFGGEMREYDALSIGTQEQLATLLRLSIAEALDSFVVMDDQLTQSDPERISRIRGILNRASEDVQVIVFTCRGEDYVDADGSAQTVVDLTSRITRTSAERTSTGPTARTETNPVESNHDVDDSSRRRRQSRSADAEPEPASTGHRTSDLAAALRDSLADEADGSSEDNNDG